MLGVAGEILLWWGASFGVWLISLSALSGQELLVAALASIPCGAAAYGTRRVIGDTWTARPRWLGAALVLPVAIVTDTAQVLWAAATGKRGRFVRVRTGFAGDSTEARAGRGVAVALVSTSPGSYALDIDPGTGEMLVHSLAPKGPRVESRLGR
ncbi:MAG TPA: Na+/H+ antiporter subunit E [Acidimicrobiales bacterium]|nr:Na+/H+ antiporter subunit E [Acidimicrobiales bacterium]